MADPKVPAEEPVDSHDEIPIDPMAGIAASFPILTEDDVKAEADAAAAAAAEEASPSEAGVAEVDENPELGEGGFVPDVPAKP